MSPCVQWLHNGRKLHLQHGPIDLLIEVRATNPSTVCAAYQIAINRFQTVLAELVTELPALRTRTNTDRCCFRGSIAKRMWHAASECELADDELLAAVAADGATGNPEGQETGSQCANRQCAETQRSKSQTPGTHAAANKGFHSGAFHSGATTPMIAVAGAVADEVLSAIVCNEATKGLLQKVSVNNGGDIALFLNHAECYTVGVVANPDDARINGSVKVFDTDGIGGVATSGWRGRSQSLGIADSVTVLAATAAVADAAATLIGNAVKFDTCVDIVNQSPENNTQVEYAHLVKRQPANELDPDSDLGCALVTTDVAPLPKALIDNALNNGRQVARVLEHHNIIAGACLFLQGSHRVVGRACEPINQQLAASASADLLDSRLASKTTLSKTLSTMHSKAQATAQITGQTTPQTIPQTNGSGTSPDQSNAMQEQQSVHCPEWSEQQTNSTGVFVDA